MKKQWCAGVATLRPAGVSRWRVGRQREPLASRAAVKSPWLSPSSARILRWVNKVPPARVSLSLPSATAHMTEAAAGDYTFRRWCYGSPRPSHSSLPPTPSPLASTCSRRKAVSWFHPLGFSSALMPFPFFFPSHCRSVLPRFPGVRFPPFFSLLPERALSPSLC